MLSSESSPNNTGLLLNTNAQTIDQSSPSKVPCLPTTPVKVAPVSKMEVDEPTPKKTEPMDVDETSLTPSKKPYCDFSISEEFIDFILTQILGISVRSERSELSVSKLCPNYPLLVNIQVGNTRQNKTLICNLILEALECIVHCDTTLSSKLFKDKSIVNCYNYLIDCYNRMEDYKKTHSKKCSVPAVRELLNQFVLGLCAAFTSLLEGYIVESGVKNYHELLYEGLKTHSLPSEFFFELVQYLQADAVRFHNVFSPLLLIIRNESQKGTISDGSHRSALQILSNLCEHRSNANSSVRPFCNLITQMSNWIVEPLTEATGREFAKFTYLGPFLCTSLFAEDDPKMAEKLKAIASESMRPVVGGLQQEMEFTRTLLHKVIVKTELRINIRFNIRYTQGIIRLARKHWISWSYPPMDIISAQVQREAFHDERRVTTRSKRWLLLESRRRHAPTLSEDQARKSRPVLPFPSARPSYSQHSRRNKDQSHVSGKPAMGGGIEPPWFRSRVARMQISYGMLVPHSSCPAFGVSSCSQTTPAQDAGSQRLSEAYRRNAGYGSWLEPNASFPTQ